MFKHVSTTKFIAKMAFEAHIVMKRYVQTLYTYTIEPKTIRYFFNAQIMENVHNQDAYVINIGQAKIVVSTQEKNVKVSYSIIGQS